MLRRLRHLYDIGDIKSEDDFVSELSILNACNWVNKTLGGINGGSCCS